MGNNPGIILPNEIIKSKGIVENEIIEIEIKKKNLLKDYSGR